MRKPPITDGGSDGGEGNVYHGPWPERADASQPAEQPPASGANWMRDADAIASGLVETPASRTRDEFFDELASSAAARAGEDDLDAFITRAGTTAAATVVAKAPADGSAALPSDIEVTKPARHIRVNTFGPRAWRASIARFRARDTGVHGRRVPTSAKRMALSGVAIGIIAALTAVAFGALSGAGKPAPATLAGMRDTNGRTSKQPSAILPVLRGPATDRRRGATKAAHRARRDAHQRHHTATHPAASRPANGVAQPVSYIHHSPPTTTSTVVATRSSSLSSTPTAGSAAASQPASAGPTGAGTPFAPGQQVK